MAVRPEGRPHRGRLSFFDHAAHALAAGWDGAYTTQVGLPLLPLFPLPLVLYPGTTGVARCGLPLLASAVDTIESRARVDRRANGNGHGPRPLA